MVEVIDGEVALIAYKFHLPVGLPQICGGSISSVFSLINWRSFELQEQALFKLYPSIILTAAPGSCSKAAASVLFTSAGRLVG
jgi:hypothetical protein